MTDVITLAAIGAISGLTALALVLGVSDGALQAAIAVLAGLGGYKLAQRAIGNSQG